MKKTLFGVSGVAGSFSEEAAILYAQQINIHPSLVYLIDMEGVLEELESGKIDMGIFPVVNLRGGLVKPAFQAMGKHLFTPIDELWLEVKQCLLVLPGTTMNQITKIVSHPQAFSQCEHYLLNNFTNIERVEWVNTAAAAKDLAEGRLTRTTAVIASERSANIYDLEVIASNIHDSNQNLTAFIVAKELMRKTSHVNN